MRPSIRCKLLRKRLARPSVAPVPNVNPRFAFRRRTHCRRTRASSRPPRRNRTHDAADGAGLRDAGYGPDVEVRGLDRQGLLQAQFVRRVFKEDFEVVEDAGKDDVRFLPGEGAPLISRDI